MSPAGSGLDVPLEQDPRWRRINGRSTPCPCCGETFDGIFDIGFDHPAAWPHGNRTSSDGDELMVGQDRLGSDICHLDGYIYLRGVLLLPIRGSGETFGFGCWGSVSQDTFARYLADIDGGPAFEGGFSWLSNILPTFGRDKIDYPVAANLRHGGKGQRPLLYAQDGPIAEAQSTGITFEHLLDIYAATGNDLRPHLTD